jgi:hypothetical protein
VISRWRVSQVKAALLQSLCLFLNRMRRRER